MRPYIISLVTIACLLGGCQSGQLIETRTHTIAPSQVERLPAWEKTIETTVTPEKWNEKGSPHRISIEGNHLTIRTTRANQEAILKYLSTVITAQ